MASKHEVERLYAEHSQRLRRYLQLKTRQADLAADLTQECFTRLLQRDEPLPNNPLSYLFTVANHLLIDHRRNHSQARTDQIGDGALSEILDEASGPDLHAEAQRRLQRLQTAMVELPERTREVFRLCRLEGFSYGEAASALDISTSSVQKHLTTAVAFLTVKIGGWP